MDLRILDLDGSLASQTRLRDRQPALHDARAWGPRLRMACRWSQFDDFRLFLAETFASVIDRRPTLTLYGSGDFHHVSLALLHRTPGPYNLLILDKHPDWVRYLPFLHCGTWVNHALKLNQVRRVFHVGGDLDFDNAFRWLAPWEELRSRRVVVFPAVRRFQKGRWRGIENEPLRPQADARVTPDRLAWLLEPFHAELAAVPLYISVDKDVLRQSDAIVNWDSGHLDVGELDTILGAFSDAAQGRLAGMDLVGDWSPVNVEGWLRRFLHYTEHESLVVDPAQSNERNEAANLRILDGLAARRAAVNEQAREVLRGRAGLTRS
jgi:hypothetical protein